MLGWKKYENKKYAGIVSTFVKKIQSTSSWVNIILNMKWRIVFGSRSRWEIEVIMLAPRATTKAYLRHHNIDQTIILHSGQNWESFSLSLSLSLSLNQNLFELFIVVVISIIKFISSILNW